MHDKLHVMRIVHCRRFYNSYQVYNLQHRSVDYIYDYRLQEHERCTIDIIYGCTYPVTDSQNGKNKRSKLQELISSFVRVPF